MSESTVEVSDKRLKNETTSEEQISHDMVELMDLPEPVLLHIMSYLNHDFLRNIAFKVSMEWRRLAHSKVLWTRASLCYSSTRCDEFIRDLLATPYLHSLSLPLIYMNKFDKSRLLEAIVSTNCRVHQLDLRVDDYDPEILLFLKQHPEIRELKLWDKAKDNDQAASVAAIVGRLAPNLTSLNLSNSLLLYLPKAGMLLASPSIKHEESQPEGLLDFEFAPFSTNVFLHPKPTAVTGRNLSTLLHLHKHTLKTAAVYLPFQDVLKAVAECKKLETLRVLCDPSGSDLCATLQAMEPTRLRHFTLYVHNTLGAARLATVLQTLCSAAPRLETLALYSCQSTEESMDVFPGFRPLQPLLVGSGATLRELKISFMGPIGSAEFEDLVSMADDGGLSLRMLDLVVPICSVDRSPANCRENFIIALKTVAPSLKMVVNCMCAELGWIRHGSDSDSYSESEILDAYLDSDWFGESESDSSGQE